MLRDALNRRVIIDGRETPAGTTAGDDEVHLGCPWDKPEAPALCGWRPGPDRTEPPAGTAPTCAVCADLAAATCPRCGKTHTLSSRREVLDA